jgi:chromosome segregation ATPase
VCALWLCIGAPAGNALGGERDNRAAKAFVAIENERETAQANATRNEPSLEATAGKAAQTSQSAPARERRLSLEHEREWIKAEALARALTSSLQGQLDAVRSAAEAERIKQKQLLDEERGRADAFARELAFLQAEFDKARTVGLEAVQTTEAESNQKHALDQERDKAEKLARELARVRAELDAARIAVSEVVQATEEQSKQKLALEQAVKQERDKADALARELASVRAGLDTARAAARDTAQTREAQGKQKQALEQAVKQERDKQLGRNGTRPRGWPANLPRRARRSMRTPHF